MLRLSSTTWATSAPSTTKRWNRAGGRKVYGYYYTFNGFAAAMTLEQANKMSAQAGVISVTPNEVSYVDTSSTPTFLGLTDPGGLWEQARRCWKRR